MTTFTDKRNRTIEIEEGGDSIYAYHNGKQIGFLHTSGQVDMGKGLLLAPEITGWEMDPDYRGVGIMGELLRYAVEEHFGEALRPGRPYVGVKDENALTDEGFGITRWGQKKGYITGFDPIHYDESDPRDDE